MTAGTSLVGKTIAGRFRVTGQIGEGAMAVVYRAKPVAGGPDVAVKVMQADLEGDPTFVARFKREARSAAKLDHPNTVKILDFGEEDGRLYMAMELLEGEDLFDAIKRRGALSPDRAVKVLMQVASALEAAHDLGIVHRDLKPENVYLLKDDRVKVLDFGIAKILERDDAPPSSSDEQLTTVGMVVGTPEYMSPEQCIGVALDARSDIYACGIVLFQMLTRRPPFYGGSQLEIAISHMERPAPKLGTLLPGVDPRLEALVERCLEKLPEKRFQTARELRAALEPLASASPSGRLAARDSGAPLSRAVLSRHAAHAPTSGPLSLRFGRPKLPSRPDLGPAGPTPASPGVAPRAPELGGDRPRSSGAGETEDGPASITRPNVAPMDLGATLASPGERRSVLPRIDVVEAPPPAPSKPELEAPRRSELARSVETAPVRIEERELDEGPSTRRSIPFPTPKPSPVPEPMPAWKLFALAVFVGVGGGVLAYLLLRR